MFGPKRDEVAGGWTGEDCIMRSCIICTLHQILLGFPNRGDGRDMLHTWEVKIAYIVLVATSERKRPFGRSRCR
jgi:hypothetical protein